MTFLDSLERRFGHLAIPGLIRIVVILNAFVYLLAAMNPQVLGLLVLDRDAVLSGGQYWRLITFLFIPGTSSPFFILFALWFLWHIGNALEAIWGSFKLTLFYLIGAVATVVAAMIFGSEYSNALLNISLFFAYARFFPDAMMLFPPIPIRWAAWIAAAFIGVAFITGGIAYQSAAIASLLNYMLFFGPETVRNLRHREVTARRRRKFEAASLSPETSLHQCATCGRTEKSHPALDFRVSRDGNEYCTEHLPSPPSRA